MHPQPTHRPIQALALFIMVCAALAATTASPAAAQEAPPPAPSDLPQAPSDLPDAPAPAPSELPEMPPPPVLDPQTQELVSRDRVQLTNFSDQPFKFHALLVNGRWTELLTIEPGQVVPIREEAQRGGVPVLGVDAPKQFAIIRYQAYGGWVHWRLAGRQLPGDAAPHWYFMVDSNGNGHLVQARTEEDAVRVRDQLKSRTPLTAKELATTKATLRANWVLHGG